MPLKKILILNTTYNKGGAARIASQIFNYMNEDKNFDVYFEYGRGTKNNNKKIFKFGLIIENYLHIFLVRFLGIEGFGTYFSTRKLIKFIKKENFNLIHIHNVHGYYLNFFTLFNFLNKSGIPVVWTLHDEWPITWMPAHSMGCIHCKTLEGKCINSYEYPKTYNKLFSKFMLSKKKEYFSKKINLNIICPSEWIKKEIERSYLKNCNIKFIPNGVDVNVFKPLDHKKELREKYSIPLNKKIVLFSVSNIKDVNKGYGYISELAKKSINDNIFFIGVGSHDIENTKNIKVIDYISSEKSIVEIYNLADVFLYTSLVETMPLTVMESMACGLPVVAFDIPGVNELIDKDCGLLSKTKDISGLVSNLKFLFENEKNRESMSILSRQKIVNYLSLNKLLSEYKDLYNNILNL